jgi:alanine-synthesizing transaminase
MLYAGAEFVPLATLAHDTLCATLSGLSKIYRACGYRVGWVSFSGRVRQAAEYLAALELLSSLRLCAAVPAQWAVQTALGGHQSICELVSPGGRLYESRAAILAATQASRFLKLRAPAGAMYAFVAADTRELPGFDDQRFALDLLEQKHVLIAPGVSFNVPYRTHFRVTNLPQPDVLREVFARMEEPLSAYAEGGPRSDAGSNIVDAQSRFK